MKKPIALIITDTHLDEGNAEINKSIYSQAFDIADELGLKQIDHGGDLYDSRKAQTQENLVALNDIFDMAAARDIHINIVVGNHDKTNYSSPKSFLVQSAHHPAVTVYPIFGYRALMKNITLYYMSFFKDSVYIDYLQQGIDIWNKIGMEDAKNKSVLLTHIGCEGAVMNNGTIVGKHIPTRITPSLFTPFDLTLIGHYHDFQQIADGKIRYIGASIQHNFGELLGKGVTILYDDLSTEIRPLKYPEYIKYEVDPKDLTKQDIEDLQAEKKDSGNNIRIVLVGSEADVKTYNKQALQEAGISVQLKHDEIDREELESRVEAFDGKSLYEEFESYCEKKGIDKTKGVEYLTQVI